MKLTVPNSRLPSVPDVAATIWRTWLVPTAVRAGNPNSTISGTDKTGPPAPVSPEPKPAIEPIPARTDCSERLRASKSGCRTPRQLTSALVPAKMINTASRTLNIPGWLRELIQLPINPSNAAPEQIQAVILQSILPRRWNIQLPAMPVKMKVKSAVAIAPRECQVPQTRRAPESEGLHRCRWLRSACQRQVPRAEARRSESTEGNHIGYPSFNLRTRG